MRHDHTQQDHRTEHKSGFWTSRTFLVFLGFSAIALFLLWEEHRAHILGILPYLFLLACPLMHVFMHGGHGEHHGHHGPDREGGGSDRSDGETS